MKQPTSEWQPEPRSPVLGRELSFLFPISSLDQISRPTDYLTSETAGEKGRAHTSHHPDPIFLIVYTGAQGSSPRPSGTDFAAVKNSQENHFDLKTAGVSPWIHPELSSSSNCSGSPETLLRRSGNLPGTPLELFSLCLQQCRIV